MTLQQLKDKLSIQGNAITKDPLTIDATLLPEKDALLFQLFDKFYHNHPILINSPKLASQEPDDNTLTIDGNLDFIDHKQLPGQVQFILDQTGDVNLDITYLFKFIHNKIDCNLGIYMNEKEVDLQLKVAFQLFGKTHSYAKELPLSTDFSNLESLIENIIKEYVQKMLKSQPLSDIKNLTEKIVQKIFKGKTPQIIDKKAKEILTNAETWVGKEVKKWIVKFV